MSKQEVSIPPRLKGFRKYWSLTKVTFKKWYIRLLVLSIVLLLPIVFFLPALSYFLPTFIGGTDSQNTPVFLNVPSVDVSVRHSRYFVNDNEYTLTIFVINTTNNSQNISLSLNPNDTVLDFQDTDTFPLILLSEDVTASTRKDISVNATIQASIFERSQTGITLILETETERYEDIILIPIENIPLIIGAIISFGTGILMALFTLLRFLWENVVRKN